MRLYARSPTEITETQLQVIANLTLRANNSDWDTLGAARVDADSHVFTETFRSLLPSMAALKEHTKRNTYISGHLWDMAYQYNPV